MGCAWNKESVYDNEINPLMAKIIEICKREKMPIVCSIQYEDSDENGAGICTTVITEDTASPKMKRLGDAHRPERPIALTEIHETMPDGSKRITIRPV